MILHRRTRSRRFARRGVASIEMALVFPLLLLIAFGIIEFGQLFFVRLTLINAAREGARTATLMIDPADKAALVQERTEAALIGGGLSGKNYTIEYVSAPSPGVEESVTVSIPFFEVSLLGGYFSFTDITLTGSCTMSRDTVG